MVPMPALLRDDTCVMRLPGEGGAAHEVTILGRGLTYSATGGLLGGTVWRITVITSDPVKGDTKQSWAITEGMSVRYLPAHFAERPDLDVIGGLLPRLIAAEDPVGGGDTPDGGEPPAPTGRTILGTADQDRLRGTDLGEKIYGKEDDDRIRGRDGDDTIMGGSGDDRIRGDKGDDAVFGNSGDDRMRGDAGADTLDGGSGNDRMRGDQGCDLVTDLAGDNRLRGGAGNDTLATGTGNDVMIGGKGDDVIIAGGGQDFAMGQDGTDTFVFDGGNAGTLRIRGFDGTADRIDVAGLTSADEELAAFRSEARQVGRDVVWTHGATTVILLETDLDSLGPESFAGASVIPDSPF